MFNKIKSFITYPFSKLRQLIQRMHPSGLKGRLRDWGKDIGCSIGLIGLYALDAICGLFCAFAVVFVLPSALVSGFLNKGIAYLENIKPFN